MHVMVIPRDLYGVPQLPFAGVFERQQVAALRRGGVDVGVLSAGVITTRHLGRRFPYAPVDTLDGVVVHRAPRRAYLPARWESPLAGARRGYPAMRRSFDDYVAAQGRPDVVHAHNHASGGVLARMLHDDYGIPYVITEHSSIYINAPRAVAVAKPAVVLASAKAARIVAVSHHLAGHLGSVLPPDAGARMVVVPNVVDPALLERETTAGSTDAVIVGALGNLVPGKNFGMLVRAFAQADLPSGSRLVIGGEGPERAALESLAQTLGIAEQVELAGPLDRPGVGRLFARSTVFAHPSNFESFGVVLIEAMACGVPVVATASGGPDEIVTPDVGRLVPIGDGEMFAHALGDVVRDHAAYSPSRIRDACRERFGPETFVRTMTEIYEEAAS